VNGTLIALTEDGEYAALVADLRRRLKEAKIGAIVRPKRGWRVLVQGPSPGDISTFMYLDCFGFSIVNTDI
jgi:hypothetical protein